METIDIKPRVTIFPDEAQYCNGCRFLDHDRDFAGVPRVSCRLFAKRISLGKTEPNPRFRRLVDCLECKGGE